MHIDTDLGGDPDDACALAMVLGWPDVEITGITTTADPDGRRAGYVEMLLDMCGASGVPVAAGAAASSTTGRAMGGVADHARFWGDLPEPPVRTPTPAASLELLAHSIGSGATVVAIGPYTNLALLERSRPGALDGVPVFVMGGWVGKFGEGFPAWGPDRDWNVVCDPDAALVVFGSGAHLTLVPCPAAGTAWLRTTDLPRLSASGSVGSLLARQSTAHAKASGYSAMGASHAGLPDDLVNFHWDPVTCAAALGWPGISTAGRHLRPRRDQHALWFEDDAEGRRTTVVTAVDGTAFAETWLTAVEAAQGRMG